MLPHVTGSILGYKIYDPYQLGTDEEKKYK